MIQGRAGSVAWRDLVPTVWRRINWKPCWDGSEGIWYLLQCDKKAVQERGTSGPGKRKQHSEFSNSTLPAKNVLVGTPENRGRHAGGVQWTVQPLEWGWGRKRSKTKHSITPCTAVMQEGGMMDFYAHTKALPPTPHPSHREHMC